MIGIAVASTDATWRLARRTMILGIAGASLGACAQHYGRPGLLDFLKRGVTSREDALKHLGRPSGSFENGRILTWYLAKDEDGYYVGAPKASLDPESSLVLVFDANGLLTRQALVPLTPQQPPEPL